MEVVDSVFCFLPSTVFCFTMFALAVLYTILAHHSILHSCFMLLFQIYLLLAEKEEMSTSKSVETRILNLTKALGAVSMAISRLCVDDDPVCSYM